MNRPKWNELDTKTEEGKEALNLIIAERLGWVEIEETRWWDEDWYGSAEMKGFVGISPETYKAIVPDYCDNLNAAIKLEHKGYNVFLTVNPFKHLPAPTDEWTASYFEIANQDNKIVIWDDNPAVAVCKAWLVTGDKLSSAEKPMFSYWQHSTASISQEWIPKLISQLQHTLVTDQIKDEMTEAGYILDKYDNGKGFYFLYPKDHFRSEMIPVYTTEDAAWQHTYVDYYIHVVMPKAISEGSK